MADVFVGYTRSDKAIAEQVVEALEALGLTIYWDTNLPAGEVWNEALERELREAPCTSVLWSSSSENRHYVRKEADLALELATLVTASIEHVQQPPEYYTINCADLRDFKPDAAHDGWLSLLEGIGVKLKRPGLREYAFLRSQAETEALGWAEWATKYPDDPCVDEAWKKVAAGANRAATTWIAQAREVASGREDPETRITNVRAILNVEIQPAIQRVPQSRYRMGLAFMLGLTIGGAIGLSLETFDFVRPSPPRIVVASPPEAKPMAEEERIGGQSLVGAHSVEDRSIRSHIKGKSVAVFFDDYNDEIAVSARDQLKSAGAKVKLIPMSVPSYEWVARNNNLKYGDVASLDSGHQIKEMLKELVPLKVKYKSDLSDDIDLALYFFGH